MKIKGIVSHRLQPPAPTIRSLMRIPSIGSQYITLLIDTGASTTALLDLDAMRFGITLAYAKSRLRPSPRKMVGIGGAAETYIIPSVELTFRSEDGATIETTDLYVVLHDPERLGLENYERILPLPSILGRDIINKYKLMYQAPTHEVYLER